MLRTRYFPEIAKAAADYRLDPVLVEAIVVQESAGNADAFRWERDFWNRLLKPKPEWASKNPRRVSSSYGLMQIMFPVAVERGYDPAHPPEMLFVPEVGLRWGCKHLAYLKDWADRGWPQIDPQDRLTAVLASYNGGRGGNTPGTPLRPQSRSYALSVLNYYQILAQEHKTNP